MRLCKKALAIALSAAMVITTGTVAMPTVKTISSASSSFQNLNQSEITAAMGAGWNLGNQLEAAVGGTPGETNWGNPVVTEDLILAVKDAGFKSVRIPVSYLSMIGSDSNYTIQESWLDRVQEVVDYCIDNDMYAIINMHGDGYTSIDGGWLLCGNSDQTQICAKYEACWKQIASRFKDYDERLVFESMNEEFDGTYGTPNSTAYANINKYNQIFVDTVRQTGGNNDKRWLLIPGWNTNIDYTAGNYGFELPSDNYISSDVPSNEKRIMISVHYYDPWDFCGTESGAVTQWGDTVTDSSKVASWGDESYMVSQFKKMNDAFVDKGYPVVIGEYGSIDKSSYDSANIANRAEFAYKVCYYADQYGLIPVYWDNGYNGTYGFGLFDRYTYKVTQSTIINSIMEVYAGSTVSTATGITLDQTELSIGVGEGKKTITATLAPVGCTDKISWKSSDEDVATVNSKGEVTAVSVGTCTITAFTANGCSATCKVTVPKSSNVKAKLYLLETAGWQSVISDESVDIDSNGGSYSLSLEASDSQLKNIGSLYIRDISVGDEEASAFDKATIKVESFEVNGKTYSMKNDTFTYDVSKEASDDGLENPVFNFSFINVWANTHINDVTVDTSNYKASFNNVSYQTANTVTMNFVVSDINSGSGETEEPTPTVEPTVEPTVAPTVEPTVAPTVEPTVAPTVEPTVEPTVAPTVEPTVAPTEATVIAENTSKYESNDASWLMNAADDTVISLTYTCEEASHGNWGVLGWGASVDGNWVNGTSYCAAANATDEVTTTCTAAELKESMGIISSSNVSYICLSSWNGGKIVSLSILGVGDEDGVEPTVAPTVEPTVAPTVEPTVEPTVTPESTETPDTDDEESTEGTVIPATFTLKSDWGSGGLGSIEFTNTTGKAFTEGWTIEFTLDREITSMWSGVMEKVGTNRYRVSNPGWGAYLEADATVTLDFSVGGGESNPTMSEVVIY